MHAYSFQSERRKREIPENNPWSLSYESNDDEDNDEVKVTVKGPLTTCLFVGQVIIHWLDGNTRLGHSSFDIVIPCKKPFYTNLLMF